MIDGLITKQQKSWKRGKFIRNSQQQCAFDCKHFLFCLSSPCKNCFNVDNNFHKKLLSCDLRDTEFLLLYVCYKFFSDMHLSYSLRWYWQNYEELLLFLLFRAKFIYLIFWKSWKIVVVKKLGNDFNEVKNNQSDIVYLAYFGALAINMFTRWLKLLIERFVHYFRCFLRITKK